MSRLVIAFVAFPFAACAQQEEVPLLEVGQTWSEARRSLEIAGSKKTEMAILPAGGAPEEGSFECHELPDGAVVAVTHRPPEGGGASRVVSILYCPDADRPKSEREWIGAERVLLRRE